MFDRIMAAITLLALGGYLSVFVFRVREFDLWIVLGIVFLMAAYDFATQLMARRKK